MVFEQFLFEQKKTNGRQDLFLNGKSHKKNPFFLTFPLILCHHQGDVIYTAKKPAHICYAITEIIRFQWYDHRAESCLLWKSVLDEIRFILCMLLGGLACCFHFYRNCQFHFHSCLLWKSVLGGWGGEVRWVAQFVFPLSPLQYNPPSLLLTHTDTSSVICRIRYSLRNYTMAQRYKYWGRERCIKNSLQYILCNQIFPYSLANFKLAPSGY